MSALDINVNNILYIADSREEGVGATIQLRDECVTKVKETRAEIRRKMQERPFYHDVWSKLREMYGNPELTDYLTITSDDLETAFYQVFND